MSYIDYKQLIGLYDLNLDYNQIANIEVASFPDMNYLKQLHLSTNQLIAIIFAMFHGLTDLNVLDLANNKIVTMQRGVFEDLPVLAFVNLTNNKLTGIKVNEFPFYHYIYKYTAKIILGIMCYAKIAECTNWWNKKM